MESCRSSYDLRQSTDAAQDMYISRRKGIYLHKMLRNIYDISLGVFL
jgi:hypothetical protein